VNRGNYEEVHSTIIGTWVIGIWEVIDMVGRVVPKIWFHHKNRYLPGFIKAISNYMFGIFIKKINLVSGCGINNKGWHYWNCLTWVMLLTKIHYQRMVTIVNFRSNLFRRLRQKFYCLLELKNFKLGSSIGCNSLLLLKNIIFSRGSNMALRTFHIYSHDQLLHQVNFSVNSYFWFSFFNVDFDL
jgi:hypothetical protein